MEQTIPNKTPRISVIVPVYKVEDYLDACVESILGQTEQDFELLLIDDGSPDGCPALCDAWAAKDPRVRVIHKSNGGVSAARNTGLDEAAGEYVVFIDSDDWVDADHLESLLQAKDGVRAPERTLIVTDYQPFAPDGEEQRDFPAPFEADLRSTPVPAQAFRDLIFGFRLFPPYCKLYRREVIEALHLRFNTEIRTAEDFDFNMRYLEGVDLIRYLPAANYHYRVAYKRYRPSNHGVLGDSEIKSAHIMANGIVALAKRMDVYEMLEPEIANWAAKKHYYNRLPMLFAPSANVHRAERKQLYKQLIADPVYREAAKQGIRSRPAGTMQRIGSYLDCFTVWDLFYKVLHRRTRTSKE